ncbi:MAG: glycine cleavage system protein GcvH [Bacteriovoracaceae bacterium]|jgi:glycine cleavage system H protein|nr:glycine cleavage system protein GcvH [Bacteriovoracaceae bacterium]
MSKIIDGLYYTKEHEWLKIDGDNAKIGITDFAQSSLGDIVFVELPDEGENLDKDASFGVVESIKSVSDLYTPISGEVIAKNSDAEDSPEQLNENSFEAWLIEIKMNDKTQLDSLMNAAAYKEYCESNS